MSATSRFYTLAQNSLVVATGRAAVLVGPRKGGVLHELVNHTWLLLVDRGEYQHVWSTTQPQPFPLTCVTLIRSFRKTIVLRASSRKLQLRQAFRSVCVVRSTIGYRRLLLSNAAVSLRTSQSHAGSAHHSRQKLSVVICRASGGCVRSRDASDKAYLSTTLFALTTSPT